MKSFSACLDSRRVDDDTFAFTVDDGWQQGYVDRKKGALMRYFAQP